MDAVDSRFEGIKRDLLKRDPLPTAEAAFGEIKREEIRLSYLEKAPSVTGETSLGAGLTVSSRGGRTQSSRGRGRGRTPPQSRGSTTTELLPTSSSMRSSSSSRNHTIRCNHCGRRGHAQESCFEIIGFPEWWNERKSKSQNSGGTAATAIAAESSEKPEEEIDPAAAGIGVKKGM